MDGVMRLEDAARLLGVSEVQVGRLIQSGDLLAERFGRAWMVDPESVRRRARLRARQGRPLSPANAWRRVAEAAHSPERVSVKGLNELAVAVRRRAELAMCRALPADLDALVADERLVLSGVVAAAHHGAAVESSPPFDLYARSDDWPGVRRDHGLRLVSRSSDANVRVRVVPAEVWPFEAEARHAVALVAALDLVDGSDLRSAAEAVAVVARPKEAKARP